MVSKLLLLNYNWCNGCCCSSRVLCISTSFQVLAAPESWSKYFFQPFSTFFVYFKPFSVISWLKSTKKRLKMNKKTWLCLLLKAGRHALIIVISQLKSTKNHWKSFEMNKKGWKTSDKMFRPAFGYAQHPKAGLNTQHSLMRDPPIPAIMKLT